MKTTTLHITDDIDGSPDAETTTITIDGRTVEIDLAPHHRQALDNFIAPFLDAGRPLRNGKQHRDNGHQRQTQTQRRQAAKEIRQWWADNPDSLPTWQARGAIPAAVITAWEHRANGSPATKPRKRRFAAA